MDSIFTFHVVHCERSLSCVAPIVRAPFRVSTAGPRGPKKLSSPKSSSQNSSQRSSHRSSSTVPRGRAKDSSRRKEREVVVPAAQQKPAKKADTAGNRVLRTRRRTDPRQRSTNLQHAAPLARQNTATFRADDDVNRPLSKSTAKHFFH